MSELTIPSDQYELQKLSAQLEELRQKQEEEEYKMPERSYTPYEQFIVEHPIHANTMIRLINTYSQARLKSYNPKKPPMSFCISFFLGNTSNEKRDKLLKLLNDFPAYKTTDPVLLYYRFKALSDNEFNENGIPTSQIGMILYTGYGFRAIKQDQ